MTERKTAAVIFRQQITPELEIFRIIPEEGSRFPPYLPGQFITLSRDNCRLTKKVIDANGQSRYIFDIDENGNQKIGTVTHHFSIASAPYQTLEHGYIELYIANQLIETNIPGIFSDSLFHIDVEYGDKIFYLNKMSGDFTLEQRAKDFDHVIMVATGTGLAPFISMIRQIHHEASQGNRPHQRFTLLYANRTVQELAYHEELSSIEQEQRFDFVYLPSVTRPIKEDYHNDALGKGRVGALLQLLLGISPNIVGGKSSLIEPILPKRYTTAELQKRMNEKNSVMLVCGNAEMMGDVKRIAELAKIRFEMEEW